MMKVYLHCQLRTQRGFGIIELMIALALGIIIMLGVTQVATDNSLLRYELDRTGRQIENASYAMREIESDLLSAGYWGEMGAQTVGDVLPEDVRVCPVQSCDRADNETLADATCELNRMMRFPVQGGTGDFDCPSFWNDDPGTLFTEVVPKAGSNYIAVRRASSCALGSAGCDGANGNYHLQVNACFDPSDDAAPLPGVDYALEPIANTPDFNVFKFEQRDCDTATSLETAAPIYRLRNRIYFINADDQLVRAELMWNAGANAHQYEMTALVEGVEMLRLEYGMDRDGDGQVDEDVNGYTLEPTTDLSTDPVTEDAFPDAWSDVVMVRISLVVRNVDSSAGFTDTKDYVVAGEDYDVPADFVKHRRQVYVRTVGLRNVAGRRQD